MTRNFYILAHRSRLVIIIYLPDNANELFDAKNLVFYRANMIYWDCKSQIRQRGSINDYIIIPEINAKLLVTWLGI